MTPAELAISIAIYVASLLLGDRLVAMILPQAQEAAFAIAAVLGICSAAIFYYRRQVVRASAAVMISVGGVMAIACVVAGIICHLFWQAWFIPGIALPVAAVATLLAPLVIFPIVRRLFDEDDQSIPTQVSGQHVIIATSLAALLIAIAFSLPAQGRSTVQLRVERLPGIAVALPDWLVVERASTFDYGTIKLDDPDGVERYMALHWSTGDPVQPHEYVSLITGGQLNIVERQPVTVSGHEGVRFYLESADHGRRAYATIWNCPQDHRSMWLFSYLSSSNAVMLDTHERVAKSIRCHRADEKSTTQSVFPSFIPPSDFEQDENSSSLLFTGPNYETILFVDGVTGMSNLVIEEVPDDVVAGLIRQIAGMDSLEGRPTVSTVKDLLGHERRVWSAVGTTSAGTLLQVEVMVWYCDDRNKTFIGAYATKGKHPVEKGVDVLIPAACHAPK